MTKQLSLIFLSCLLLIIFSTRTASAEQTTNTSFFSFLQHAILAYTTTELSNKQILAAHTVANEQLNQNTLSTPQPVPQLSHISSFLLQEVNKYRASLGLSPVQPSMQTCAFAKIRAKEITTDFSHDAFYARVHNHSIPYTTWARATENIAEAPTYKEIVTLWKNSPEHAANMRDNTPYVCIMQSGNYYAYEGMRR